MVVFHNYSLIYEKNCLFEMEVINIQKNYYFLIIFTSIFFYLYKVRNQTQRSCNKTCSYYNKNIKLSKHNRKN